MPHDASKVVLGTVQSSERLVTPHEASPVTFPAGIVVRQKDDGALSVTKADGRIIGVSIGKALSDHVAKTAVCRQGYQVPVLLELAPARLEITITSYANLVASTEDTLQFEHAGLSLDETLTFAADAAGEDEVLCAASGSTNAVVAAALAAAINAHSVLGVHFVAAAVGAVVTVTAKNNALLGEDFDVTYTANTSVGLTLDDTTFTGGGIAADYVAIGQRMYVSDTTGKADDPASGSTVTNGIYRSGVLTGIKEDGTEAACVLVDMGGGL